MDGWNTTFLLGKPIFRGYVSFREGSVLLLGGPLMVAGSFTWMSHYTKTLTLGTLSPLKRSKGGGFLEQLFTLLLTLLH